MTIEITHIDGICNTEALPIAVEGWNALLQADLADGGVLLCWDDRAVIAKTGDDVLGVILWVRQDWMKNAFIKLGYVRPAFRRSGVYTAMWNALVEHVRDTPGLANIIGATSEKNDVLQKFAESVGRKTFGRVLTYKVK